MIPTQKLLREFLKWGSSFNLEGERDYHTKGKPLYFHLRMYGLCYAEDYEISGNDLAEMMMMAIKDGRKKKRKESEPPRVNSLKV